MSIPKNNDSLRRRWGGPFSIGPLLPRAALAGVLFAGCRNTPGTDPGASQRPVDLVQRNAVYTIEDGRVVRIPGYRGTTPILGQCVSDRNYELAIGNCLGGKPLDTIDLAILDRQDFRASSQLVSVETHVGVEAAGQKVKSSVTVARHRLFIEWARYRTYSLDPRDLSSEDLKGRTYISGVELGIGVRVIMDVKLTAVDADANLSFGFGQIAAQVAVGAAQVEVQYDTVGVPEDILPADLPIAITSVNDMTTTMRGLYGAVEKISAKWNDRLDEFRPLELRIINDDTARTLDEISAEELFLGQPGRKAFAPVPPPLIHSAASLDALNRVATEVRDAADKLKAMSSENKQRLGHLYRSAQPLLVAVDASSVSAKQTELIGSIVEHYRGLQAIQADLRGMTDAKVRRDTEALIDRVLQELPERLRTAKAVRQLLSPYFPNLSGDEPILFPAGFSAGTMAYYVTRTDENARRDHCEDKRLAYALRGQPQDEQARQECGLYWRDTHGLDRIKRDWCERRTGEFSARATYPHYALRKRLERRCDPLDADAAADILSEGKVQTTAIEALLKRAEGESDPGKRQQQVAAAKAALAKLDGWLLGAGANDAMTAALPRRRAQYKALRARLDKLHTPPE